MKMLDAPFASAHAIPSVGLHPNAMLVTVRKQACQ